MNPSSSLLQVSYQRGILVPEAQLWLDPMQPKSWAFISHAHADHVARHQSILASHDTIRIMQKRYGMAQDTKLVALDYHEPYEHDGFIYTLLPAGHILGSAMLHLSRCSDGSSLLYTGDFKLAENATADVAWLMPADTLIIESTFGLKRYQFPPLQDTLKKLRHFIDSMHEDGGIPVLVAYSLGKAQELIYAIKELGYHIHIHRSMAAMNEIYRDKYTDFPETAIYQNQGSLHQHDKPVLIVPPSAARSSALRKLKRARFAMLSGWALDSGATYRYQVDEAFPWSDHADYPELMKTVEVVKPKKIFTVHGFTRELARDLRARGYDAWSLVSEDQLDLGLMLDEEPEIRSSPAETPLPVHQPIPASFLAWCSAAENLQAEPARLKKQEILKNFLVTLESDEDLYRAVLWFSGYTESSVSELGPLQIGHMAVKRALQEVSGLNAAEFQKTSRMQNDLGRTATIVLEPVWIPRLSKNYQPSSLAEIDQFFQSIRQSKGSLLKFQLLKERVEKLHPLEASYVVRLITGELRVGSREGILEEAIASAFEVNADDLREGAMLLGDLAQAAIEAKNHRLHLIEPKPFVPIKVMLASPEPTSEAIWERFQPKPAKEEEAPIQTPVESIWLEDKFDGIRAQLHRIHGRVEIYTRDLKRITHQFPELVRMAAQLSDEVILDGEIIAFSPDKEKKLNFQDLQKRLGRRDQHDLFVPSEITVKYVVFDILWKNKISLLKEPLHKRRMVLEATKLPAGIQRIAVLDASSPEEIEAGFQAARRAGNEGLIAKDRNSPYLPGRRGKSWLKLKKQFSTLDVVVVKAEQGHGKRSHVLSDYTFAVRDDNSGALKVIGKAYSGLTDEEIEMLTEQFQSETVSQKGNVRKVKPRVVLEIAFDAIQASKRHDSGLALRFPRIKAIRHDKSVEEIDTLAYARQLAGIVSQT